MSPPNRRVKLRPTARKDLEAIWVYTHRQWGAEQADTYITRLSERMDFAAAQPDRFPIEKELNPPLRIAFAGSHVILFREMTEGIEVIRIRHQREDWRR